MLVRDFDPISNIVLIHPAGLKDPYYSNLSTFYHELIELIPSSVTIHLIVRPGVNRSQFNRNNIVIHTSDLFRDIWARDYFGWTDGTQLFKPIFKPSIEDDANWSDSNYTSNFNKRLIKFIQQAFSEIDLKELDLVWDGGNLIQNGSIGFATRKLIVDNPKYSANEIKQLVADKMGLDLIFVDKLKYDVLAHTDGYMSFLSEKTILLPRYPRYEFLRDELKYAEHLQQQVSNKKLQIELINERPIDNYLDEDLWNSAEGNYLNFLQLNGRLILPKFNRRFGKHDINYSTTNKDILNAYFDEIVEIDCTQLSHLGGVLRCISWVF